MRLRMTSRREGRTHPATVAGRMQAVRRLSEEMARVSVRKRKGIHRRPWQVDYRDGGGHRRSKQFATKKEADAFYATAAVEVREGVHVPDKSTVPVAKAGELWIATGEAAGLERTTIDQRRQHLMLHIAPFIGAVKLNKLNVPAVRAFQDRLRLEGRSPDMVKRVTVSLGSIMADAQERGLLARNFIRDMPRSRTEKRSKPKLRVGVDIPRPLRSTRSLPMPLSSGGAFYSSPSPSLDSEAVSCVASGGMALSSYRPARAP